MSILSRHERSPLSELVQEPGALEEHVCFYCHRSVSDPAIEWHGSASNGSTAQILLHPDCAVEFLVRLARDIHAVQLVTGNMTEDTP